MLKEIFRLKSVVILTGILLAIIWYIVSSDIFVNRNYTSLVIYGDNIKTEYTPFIENNEAYIAVDTISKTIDEYIYYDKVSEKVVITTYNNLVKMKKDDNFMEVNFEKQDINGEVKIVEGQAFVPISNLKQIYNIDVSFNATESIIINSNTSLDKGFAVNNKIPVYSDIDTSSNVLSYLNKNDEVIVYTDNLNHNRWYKISTRENIVGYIFKDSINLEIHNDEILELNKIENSDIYKDEKLSMYWQYGNNLSTLTKEEGVDVVSPTLYEMANANGDVDRKKAIDYVNKAKSYGYEVWPIITNGIDDVNYTSKETSLLMNSEKARENLIRNISNIVKEDKLDGINLDFEAMNPDDKDMYSQFVRELAPILRKDKIKLSVDVYFVNYIDRKEVGKAADYTVLMGYDQRGSWSAEAGSISEIPWTEENVKSLMENSEIPSHKIILGIPLYTRMFTSKAGSDKLITSVYTMSNALEYVRKNRLEIKYDEKAMQNYVQFTKGTTTYAMWLEDETSIKNRCNVVNNNDLAGIAIWRKGFETDSTFSIISNNLK